MRRPLIVASSHLDILLILYLNRSREKENEKSDYIGRRTPKKIKGKKEVSRHVSREHVVATRRSASGKRAALN